MTVKTGQLGINPLAKPRRRSLAAPGMTEHWFNFVRGKYRRRRSVRYTLA